MVCGDVDGDVLWGEGALAGDPIDCLDVEGIGGVGPQAADGDTALSQTQLLWHELHVVIASGAAPAVCPAFFTDDIVSHIIPPTILPWRVPLQNDGRLIDDGDDISGTRWNTCKEITKGPVRLGTHDLVQHLSTYLWCVPALTHAHISSPSQPQISMHRFMLRKNGGQK